jgi:protocatechuate 3,4-dioxygenase beta subunit
VSDPSEPRRGPGSYLYEGRPLPNREEELFDQGLAFDLETMLDRRGLLRLAAGAGLSAGLLALVGCGGSSAPSASGGATSEKGSTTTSEAATGECAVIPEETAGPFPGDGSNGPDVLSQNGIVRRDITSSFGQFSGVAEGIPLTVKIALVEATSACRALAGAAVYVWHCDREGRYSLYTEGATDQNYLRGVQEADGGGAVTFTSVFPACYAGRWPHIHFEVYPSIETAADDANRIATSQIALPENACNAVYATSGYGQSVTNIQQVSLETDNVFGDDGGGRQLGEVTGDVGAGFVVELTVPVAA